MKRSLFVTFLCLALQCLLPLAAQNVFPSAEPAMIYTNTDGERVEESSFDGDAPLAVRFEARPVNLGGYEARCEWRFATVGAAGALKRTLNITSASPAHSKCDSSSRSPKATT